MTKEIELTLITPMYNEAACLQQNCTSILNALKALKISFEYILVDDGSTDDSYEKAQGILAGEPNCRVLHYPVNRGRGYALRQGFRAAKGKYVITTESDLSWGSGIIDKLYQELLRSNADMVVASVYLPGGGLENVPSSRALLSKYSNCFMRWAFGGNVTMLSGMTRGYKSQAIHSLYLEEDRKEIHLEIIVKAQARNFQIVEIPAVIRWEPGAKRSGSLSMMRFIGPHLAISCQRSAVRLLFCGAGACGILGTFLTFFGALNKLFLLTPRPLPYLVSYGLIFFIIGLLFALFAVISIQLSFMYRSLIHLQAQTQAMARAQYDEAREE